MSRSILSTYLLINDDLVPLKDEYRFKWSIGVRLLNNISCCGQTPNIFLTSSILLNMSMPKTLAEPFVGAIIPFSIEIVVVLPAPL